MTEVATGSISKSATLPGIFEKRWATRQNHSFTKHDNYNRIQNFGEYFETGYGKKYLKDIYHESNEIFYSQAPFTKRDELISKRIVSCPVESYTFRRRFPKRHTTFRSYLEKKENVAQPPNSMTFESEVLVDPKKKRKDHMIASEPFRHAFISPWKYSYTKNDYQTCTDNFRRVRSSNIDLSKY